MRHHTLPHTIMHHHTLPLTLPIPLSFLLVPRATDAATAHALFAALVALIHKVLFESISSKEALLRLLPARLDDKLKGLIVGVIASNLAKWRQQTSNSQLSLPKLKEFDWRIDIKSASDTMARLSMPTAIVQMKVW